MRTQAINNSNFKAKYNTGKILQITTQKIFEPDGMSGHIDTLKKLHGPMPKYLGCRGYKGIALDLTEKILAKYPQIAEATEVINNIINTSKISSPEELKERIKPIIDKLGNEIDIVI